MENTRTPVDAGKMLHMAKNFTGYTLALTIVVWGFTFALMNVGLMIAALFMAMILGAGLTFTAAAGVAVRMDAKVYSE